MLRVIYTCSREEEKYEPMVISITCMSVRRADALRRLKAYRSMPQKRLNNACPPFPNCLLISVTEDTFWQYSYLNYIIQYGHRKAMIHFPVLLSLWTFIVIEIEVFIKKMLLTIIFIALFICSFKNKHSAVVWCMVSLTKIAIIVFE